MPSIEELLLKTLDDLDTENLNRFKWHLRINYSSISVADLEKANAFNTVDKMVARFTPEGAVRNTLDVLRKMNENQLAQQLEKEYKDVLNVAQTSKDTHTVDLNLQSGVSVNAPQFTGKLELLSPTTINWSSSAVDQEQKHGSTEKKMNSVVVYPSSGPSPSKFWGDVDTTTIRQLYACYLTLDPNTAHPNLFLSDRNRKVMHVGQRQPYLDHPERFDWHPQVLCRERLTGRSYWEVEWTGRTSVDIVVTYKGKRCKGDNNWIMFGHNTQSWKLTCSSSGYSIWYNSEVTNIPAPSSNRVGVYVDVPYGVVSFYSVSDTHTFTRLRTIITLKFTKPLYAGFGVRPDSTVSLCEF